MRERRLARSESLQGTSESSGENRDSEGEGADATLPEPQASSGQSSTAHSTRDCNRPEPSVYRGLESCRNYTKHQTNYSETRREISKEIY